MILMDVDGVLTDGSIIWDDHGVQSKSFDVKDGFGIHWARRLGFKLGIITGKSSNVVRHRALELKLDEVHQGQIRKGSAYQKIKDKYGYQDAVKNADNPIAGARKDKMVTICSVEY